MPGTRAALGPFTDGLSNASPVGEVAKQELSVLTNLNVAVDGSLTSRFPFSNAYSIDWVQENWDWRILGVHIVDPNTWYLIAVRPSSSANGLYIRAYLNGKIDDELATYTDIMNVPNMTAVPEAGIQHEDYFYFQMPRDSPVGNFRWRPASVPETLTQMPYGSTLVSWKSRLFSSGNGWTTSGSRVYFSTIGTAGPDPTKWATSTDWFDVGYGLGGFVRALRVIGNSLYVFKDFATYRVSYSTNVSVASIDVISATIGAPNDDCVTSYGNFTYVYHGGVVYEFYNGNFSPISDRMRFVEDDASVEQPRAEVSLSVVGSFLVLQYKNALYAYHFKTKTWALWRSQIGVPGRWFQMPVDGLTGGQSRYVAASVGDKQYPSRNAILADQKSEITDRTDVQVQTAGQFGGYAGELQITMEGDMNQTIGLNSIPSEYLDSNTGVITRTVIPSFFDIQVAERQVWTYTAQPPVEFRYTAGMTKPYVRLYAGVVFYKTDGSSQVFTAELNAANSWSADFKAPNNAILMAPIMRFTTSDMGAMTTFVISNVSLKRKAIGSPKRLMYAVEEYRATSGAMELIECEMETGTFDYNEPANFKRLFWWGVDIKTQMVLEAKAIPVGMSPRVKWSDLDNYTFVDLSYGTWANPLSWREDQTDIIEDVTNAPQGVSLNGRYMVKLPKSLRFRQIRFGLKTFTQGNQSTGPVQIFNLHTFVQPKETVTAKAT